jgi:cold shock CspA family protein
VSDDGRDVAFKSGVASVSVHDRDADGDAIYDEPGGTLTSVIAEGAGAPSLSHRAMSENGRYVVFGPQVTIHDRDADRDGVFDELGVGETGTIALPFSAVVAAISADGRHVAFDSHDATLVPGDRNAARDVFVHDRDSDRNGVFDEVGGTRLTRISVNSSGSEASGNSFLGSLSDAGRFVAFASNAADLVDGDTNGGTDIFVHDRDFDGNGELDEDPASVPNARLTERVSIGSDGTEGNFNGVAAPFIAPPSISADGRLVAFVSFSSNLVPGDTNGVRDVFVRDRRSGVTTRLSLDEVGFQTFGAALSSAISADGRFVAFDRASSATDVLLADRVSGLVRRLTGAEGGWRWRRTCPERACTWCSEGSRAAPGRWGSTPPGRIRRMRGRT